MSTLSIGGARNSRSQPIGADGRRDWNHGLFECHEDPAGLCFALCCPCMMYGRNHSKRMYLNKSGSQGTAPNFVLGRRHQSMTNTESTSFFGLGHPTGGDKTGLMCCLYCLSPNLFGVGPALMQVSHVDPTHIHGIHSGFDPHSASVVIKLASDTLFVETSYRTRLSLRFVLLANSCRKPGAFIGFSQLKRKLT